MENTVRDFVIAGFSTGAGLALLQASNKGKKFKGVISINAPLHLKNITAHLSSAVVAWNKMLKKMHITKGTFEYVENVPENPGINYFKNPIRGVKELEKLMKIVEGTLQNVDIPALIIQGSNDPIVNPASALEIFEKLGTEKKEILRIFSKRHGIVRGEESAQVGDRVLGFLDKVFRKS